MRILLIEDDKKLSQAIAKQLKQSGYEVDACYDGEEAIFYGMANSYDIIILDRMLPEMDGLSVLKQLRKKQLAIPVIMVTALGEIEDRIDGLDAGADDYLVKPFAMDELLARIRALTRRPVTLQLSSIMTYQNLSLDPSKKLLFTSTTSLTLSKKEGDLLEFFIRNHDQVLTRELLLTRIWGPDSEVSDGNLDNYISFLRRRLKTVHSNAIIKTVHGIGYRLEALDVSKA